MNSIHLRKKTTEWFRDLRNLICKDFEYFENNNSKKKVKFTRSKWNKSKTKSEGGGEISILRNGNIFEKVGVNISAVNGSLIKILKTEFQELKKVLNFGRREFRLLPIFKIPKYLLYILTLVTLLHLKNGLGEVWMLHHA